MLKERKSPNELFGESYFSKNAMYKRIMEITTAIGVDEDIKSNDTNWIWKPLDKGESPKLNSADIVVPIDLEVVAKPSQKKLDPDIESLVSEFNTHVYEHPFRINPGTLTLIGIQSAAESFSPKIHVGVAKIIAILESKGYELTINKYQFGFLLIFDFINGDIPYFSDMNKKLYWGLSGNGTIIGQLKGNETKKS
jgi:hypothetical protein